MANCHDMLLQLASNNLNQLLCLMKKKKRRKSYNKKRNRIKRNQKLQTSLKLSNQNLSLKIVMMMDGAVLTMIQMIGSIAIVIIINGVRIIKIGKILRKRLLSNKQRSKIMADLLEEKANGKMLPLRHLLNKKNQSLQLRMMKLNNKRRSD